MKNCKFMYKIFMEESKKIEPTIVFWGGVGFWGFFCILFSFLQVKHIFSFIRKRVPTKIFHRKIKNIVIV